MKLPIRRKVLFLTLGLSLALVMASVFISYTIFSRQIQRETLSKVEEATWNLSEEAGRRYDDFLVKYFKQGLAIYEESREEIEEMSALGQDEFADKRTFFKTLTAELFPPEEPAQMTDSLGMTDDIQATESGIPEEGAGPVSQHTGMIGTGELNLDTVSH